MLQHKKKARTNQKGVVFKVVKRTATFMELSWSILGLCTYTVECSGVVGIFLSLVGTLT